MDRETWHTSVHGVTKSLTWLSGWTELNNTMLQQLSWRPKPQLCKPLLHLPAILPFSHSLIHTYTHPCNYPLTHPPIYPSISIYSPMHPSILPSFYLYLLLSFHSCFFRHFDGLKKRLYTKVLETQMSLWWLWGHWEVWHLDKVRKAWQVIFNQSSFLFEGRKNGLKV